jgi:hypothetical protein
VIYSRRMTSDEKKRRTGRDYGKLGGNPSLRKDGGNSETLKGADKGDDNPPLNAKRLEARVKREEKKDNLLPLEPKQTQLDDARASSAKGTRLPAGWAPTTDLRSYAIEHGFDERGTDRMAENFHDYWSGVAGAKGRKADWPATWRMWVRNQAERQGLRAPGRLVANPNAIN